MSFKDKVVWITGASTGIGKALAIELDRQGAKLAISARSEDKLQVLAETFRDALVLPMDVTSLEANLAAVDKIMAHFGRLDIAVFNAGISLGENVGAFSQQFEQIHKVNVLGLAYGIEAALKVFLPANRGHLVALGSLAGLSGLPDAGAYCSSKAAVINMMQGLDCQLHKTPITVTTVYPGFVRTPLTAKNSFPMPFLMNADKAARIMARGISTRKRDIYFPFLFSGFLRSLRFLPNAWYVRLLQVAVSKHKDVKHERDTP